MISTLPWKRYRQSRLCRLLGNPVVFTVVVSLAENKEMTTGQIAKVIGRSVPRTSNILSALRLAELVRYETEGRHARYRFKHRHQTRKILDALSGFVKTTAVNHRYFNGRLIFDCCHVFAIAKTCRGSPAAEERRFGCLDTLGMPIVGSGLVVREEDLS